MIIATNWVGEILHQQNHVITFGDEIGFLISLIYRILIVGYEWRQ